jgi:hypothetical protein
MNKSYNEITNTSKLLAYDEYAIDRVETWQDETYRYLCVWFRSNDTEMPNTIYKERICQPTGRV